MRAEFFTVVGTSFILLTFSTVTIASSCDDVLSALQQERYLAQVKQSADRLTTEYRDGPNITLSVSCALGKPNMMISWDGPKPDQQFYDLVGRAGSLVSPRSAAEIINASKRCRKQAINDSGEIATVEQKGLAIECQVFTRDGGATIISVFAE